MRRELETGLPSFGEKLKQEREKRKITLEQISSSTKIGTRMLQALEEDKFNQLPGGIFNKGFVRAYSRCVGLDEDQTVAEYLQASGDAPPPSTEIAREDGGRVNEENISRLEAISDGHPRQLPWGLFAAVLLVVALALSLWSRHQREHARQSPHSTPTTAVTPFPEAASSGDASARLAGDDRSPASATSGLAKDGSQAVRSASVSTAKTTPSVAAAAAAPGEFTVVIHAREESWIAVTADGKTVASELLAQGSERVISGRKEIIVKAGNAGGIEFRFNGKKVDAGGESGEVKTITFGRDGMVPKAPAAPSTP